MRHGDVRADTEPKDHDRGACEMTKHPKRRPDNEPQAKNNVEKIAHRMVPDASHPQPQRGRGT